LKAIAHLQYRPILNSPLHTTLNQLFQLRLTIFIDGRMVEMVFGGLAIPPETIKLFQ
jgi:hypothetical protein